MICDIVIVIYFSYSRRQIWDREKIQIRVAKTQSLAFTPGRRRILPSAYFFLGASIGATGISRMAIARYDRAIQVSAGRAGNRPVSAPF